MPRRSPYAEYERAVALYTSAGGHETLQRVTVAISRLSKRLDNFYNAQLQELGVSHGEWTVLSTLAQSGRDGSLSPSQLADLSGVSGTPTFFVNGQRHYGAYDIETLSAAVSSERRRLTVATPDRSAVERRQNVRSLSHPDGSGSEEQP